jgi:hypothetical protein
MRFRSGLFHRVQHANKDFVDIPAAKKESIALQLFGATIHNCMLIAYLHLCQSILHQWRGHYVIPGTREMRVFGYDEGILIKDLHTLRPPTADIAKAMPGCPFSTTTSKLLQVGLTLNRPRSKRRMAWTQRKHETGYQWTKRDSLQGRRGYAAQSFSKCPCLPHVHISCKRWNQYLGCKAID